MLPVFLFTLLGLTALSFAPAVDVEPRDDGESDGPPDPTIGDDGDLPPDGPALIFPGDSYVGTDGDDVLALADSFETGSSVDIDTGEGDDILNLLPAERNGPFQPVLDGASINGGAGDDLVTTAATFSTIEGGSGDDDITVFGAGGTTVLGGDGNDLLAGSLEAADVAILDGGAGNDTINGRGFDNVALRGGDGDDTILFDTPNQPGAGFAVSADGGDGDDTLIYDGPWVVRNPDVPASETGDFEAPVARGGDGSDTFRLLVDGTIPEPAGDGETSQFAFLTIADFEPGSDVIVVDATEGEAEFVSATLEEDDLAGQTTLTLVYEGPDGAIAELAIEIGATGVSWSDIVFEGDDVPEDLFPLP